MSVLQLLTIGGTGVAPFTPASLFSSGENGVWYDPTDLTTMFEDSLAMNPVHAPGNGSSDSPVGFLVDKHAPYYSSNFNGGGGFTATYDGTKFNWWVNDYTVEAWVYASSFANFSRNFVGNFDPTGGANYWSFGPENDKLRFGYYNGLYQTVTSTASLNLNQWNHIAMTKSSSGITLFVNGVANTPTAILGTPQSSNAIPLGIAYWNNGPGISGYISNLRIVNGTALYVGNFTPPTSPLTAVANTQLLTCGTFFSGNPLFSKYGTGNAVSYINPFLVSTGNHASQATSTARPTLSARYNLLTGTTLLSTQTVSTVLSDYRLRFIGSGTITLSGSATGTYSSGSHLITGVPFGSLTLTVSGIVASADLRVANDGVGLPVYQSVTSSTTYDSVGFPYYLSFDGVDDTMVSTTVSLSPTKQITGWFAMRKLSNSNADYFEGNWHASSTGRFQLFNFALTGAISVQSSGGTTVQVISGGLGNVTSRIATFSSDIAAPLLSLRIDGAASASSTSSQGAGTFANQPIYLGSDSVYYPQMRVYGAILRSTSSTLGQITDTENWLNGVAKIY